MKGDSMSEDLTKKLPQSDSEKISLILTIAQNLETRVDRLEIRLNNLERRFDDLEKKVDERLFDTRPIWEKVVADIAQLQAGQQRLEVDVREIKESVQDIDRRVSFLSDTMIRVQANYRDIDNRVHELELHQRKQSKPQT
jgi:predicted nuclease with TOPRIM domain